jgi:hypothetical protein
MFFNYDNRILINLDNLTMISIDNTPDPKHWCLTFHYVNGSTVQTPSTIEFHKVNDAFRSLKNNLKVI